MQSIVSSLIEVKNQLADLAKRERELKQRKTELEEELMLKLDELGVDQIRTDLATISVSEQVVPTVVDWDAFYKFMLENQAPYMMERRASASAFREYLELHEAPPPGVEAFVKRSISTRKVG
jgi:hypothetical protein